ncbi:hypothetical protein M9H77_08536 [Catharanthus roseus]|uniref:Uncharacterized protein n=1 Tax=Catharanthus roseus TaxID=4058 RepID=A0ACC0BY85_CATRO|nr:hypothetical protein M9H77_08536 [Catharanthus roseus]
MGSSSPIDDLVEFGTIRLLDWNDSMTDIQLGMRFVDKVQAIEMKSRGHKVTTYNPRKGIYMVRSPIPVSGTGKFQIKKAYEKACGSVLSDIPNWYRDDRSCIAGLILGKGSLVAVDQAAGLAHFLNQYVFNEEPVDVAGSVGSIRAQANECHKAYDVMASKKALEKKNGEEEEGEEKMRQRGEAREEQIYFRF